MKWSQGMGVETIVWPAYEAGVLPLDDPAIETGAPRRYCPDLSSLEDWCITFVLVARGDWGRVSNLHRPLRFTKPMRRYLRLPGAALETAPGLAPGKSRVAACRLDGFGIAVIETGERRWDLHPHRRLHRAECC